MAVRRRRHARTFADDLGTLRRAVLVCPYRCADVTGRCACAAEDTLDLGAHCLTSSLTRPTVPPTGADGARYGPSGHLSERAPGARPADSPWSRQDPRAAGRNGR